MWSKALLFTSLAVLAGCSTPSISQPAPPPVRSTSQPPAAIDQGLAALSPTPDAPDLTQAVKGVQTDLGPCAHISRHQYEVCSAYFYASGLRWAFYRYGRGQTLGSVVKDKLEDRYWSSARAQIERQAAGWPADVETTAPRITIVAISVNQAITSATLTTRESWDIQAQNGPVLFQETRATHHITLKKVPSILLHKWVVTSIR